MTVELTEEELQEIVRALQAVRQLHADQDLSVTGLTKLIEQLQFQLPGSGVKLRPKPKNIDSPGK
jgi:hypothetical protein